MILYHITHKRNVDSILSRGLWPDLADNGRDSVWLVPPDMLEWACRHVMDRHGWSRKELAMVEVNAEHYRVHRRGNGTYYVCGEVAPEDCVCWTPSM